MCALEGGGGCSNAITGGAVVVVVVVESRVYVNCVLCYKRNVMFKRKKHIANLNWRQAPDADPNRVGVGWFNRQQMC